jgi:heme a synthase
MTTVCVLLASQGIVGAAQYDLHLPTEMVWIHVGLATLTWLALLWATAAAGRLVPRKMAVGQPAEPAESLRLEPAAR